MEEKFSDREQILARLRNVAVGSEVTKQKPKISVIIPVYNDADLVAETLDSVFAQTYLDYEVVLVNDGSKDTESLRNVLKPYASRLVYAEQDNLGCAGARNSALCLSRGEYFAFLDGDDLWYPEYLSSQLEFLKSSGLDMVYCDADLIGDNYYKHSTFMATAPSRGEVNTISLLSSECNVMVAASLLKRTCLEEFGLFDQAAVRAQDFDLWIRLSLNGVKIGYQKNVLAKYRVSAASLTGTNVARVERGVTILNFVKEKYDLSGPELQALEKHLESYTTEVELEKAKLSLVEERFQDAASHLKKANMKNRTFKLTVLTAILGISPRLLLSLFKRFRASEFSFISSRDR